MTCDRATWPMFPWCICGGIEMRGAPSGGGLGKTQRGH